MLGLTATGYISGDLKIEDGDYGKRGIISLRCNAGNKKEIHYVNATFFGKKIEIAQKYLEDGRQVTILGLIKAMIPKQKKDGTKYLSIYMDAYDFSFPEMKSEEGYAATARKAVASIPDDDLGF